MTEKGVPKQDGSGGGERANKGRGGCPPEQQQQQGKGQNPKKGGS